MNAIATDVAPPLKPTRRFRRRWLLLLIPILIGVAFIPVSQTGKFEVPAAETLQMTVLVLNQAGEPVPNVQLTPHGLRTLLRPGDHWGWRVEDHGPQDPSITNDRGLATVPYPKWVTRQTGTLTKTISLVAEHPDYCVAWNSNVDVPRAGVIAAIPKIILQPGGRVRIKAFRDGESKPLANFQTQVSGQWFDGIWTQEGDAWLSPVIDPGERLFRVVDRSDPERLQFSEVITLDLTANQTEDLEVHLHPGISVKGKLNSTAPRPVKNGFVVLTSEVMPSGPIRDGIQWQTWSVIDDDGKFQFESIPPLDEIRLIAWCDGFVSQQPTAAVWQKHFPRRPSQTDFSLPQIFSHKTDAICEVQMEPTARVDVTVRNLDGSPIEGVEVSAWPNMVSGDGCKLFGAADREEKHQPKSRTCAEILQSGEDGWSKAPDSDLRLRPQFGGKTDAAGQVSITNLPPRGTTNLAVVHELLTLKGQSKPPFESNVMVTLVAGQTSQKVVVMEPKPKLTPQMLIPPPAPKVPLFMVVWSEVASRLGF